MEYGGSKRYTFGVLVSDLTNGDNIDAYTFESDYLSPVEAYESELGTLPDSYNALSAKGHSMQSNEKYHVWLILTTNDRKELDAERLLTDIDDE
jgi:hypothetical protein